jgi:hypothetical protein
VYRRFIGVGSRPERGRSGGAGVVVYDVAVGRRGSGGGTGFRGASRGELGGTRGLLGLRLAFWGEESRFVECTTRSDERVRTTSYIAVCRAVDRRRTSFTASVLITEVAVVVWASDMAVVVVSGVGLAGVAAVIGGDVAFARAGSGCERRGW